jgi:hypothetical protein
LFLPSGYQVEQSKVITVSKKRQASLTSE